MSSNIKYALVTGATGGIGEAVCRKLSLLGYCVIIHYLNNKNNAELLLKHITEQGQCGELISFDVSEVQLVSAALNQWERDHPNEYIEVVINCAGIKMDELLVFMDYEKWDKVIRTNLYGLYSVVFAVIKGMILRKHGVIVNMTSLSGLTGVKGQTNYSASKGAIIAFTRSLAKEVAVKNIRVNAIAPGFIDTPMITDLNKDELIKNIPLQRLGQPEDIANLVEFLVSEKSSYITGEIFRVAGGLSI